MLKLFTIVWFIFTSFWCVGAESKLTDEQMEKAARAVKVYRKGEPPDTCTELKEVTTPSISVIDAVGHEKMLRRMAVNEGANALMVIGGDKHSLTATLYKCPKSQHSK